MGCEGTDGQAGRNTGASDADMLRTDDPAPSRTQEQLAVLLFHAQALRHVRVLIEAGRSGLPGAILRRTIKWPEYLTWCVDVEGEKNAATKLIRA